MSERVEFPQADSDPSAAWARLWQTMAESSNRIADSWSGSMAPFFFARMAERPMGFGDSNELSGAIEKLAQGPKLADVWDIDRKMGLVLSAWVEMRQRLAAYNAVATAPWQEAAKRYAETLSAPGAREAPQPDWREAFAKWSEISNEQLILNQRSETFLKAQKELLQAGLLLRSRQDDLSGSIATIFGQPTRKEFDEVTRQLTGLRREVRALERKLRAETSRHGSRNSP